MGFQKGISVVQALENEKMAAVCLVLVSIDFNLPACQSLFGGGGCF